MSAKDKSALFDAKIIAELERCAACGTCHAVCPVYNLSGDESLSARGRIHILKELAEGKIEPGKIGRNIFDRCLLCYACETACPSGVKTSEIWINVREYFADEVGSGIKGKALKALAKPASLKTAMKLGRSLQELIPPDLLGRGNFKPKLSKRFLLDYLPETAPPKVAKKLRIGYFVGCVSNFFLSGIGLAAIEVLSQLGCEVVIPHRQVCCGAPAFNNGEIAAAKRLARQNVEVFLQAEVDAVTSADATCGGSFVHEYRQLLGDDAEYLEFANKYREIHGLILELGLPENLKSIPAKVTYHDSCHLRHTQGISAEPRRILKSLPEVELVEMKDSDLCCGFGGSFSLFHADDSVKISSDKIENAVRTGADTLVAGSPGCILKLKEEARRKNLKLEVRHVIELLAERLE